MEIQLSHRSRTQWTSQAASLIITIYEKRDRNSMQAFHIKSFNRLDRFRAISISIDGIKHFQHEQHTLTRLTKRERTIGARSVVRIVTEIHRRVLCATFKSAHRSDQQRHNF